MTPRSRVTNRIRRVLDRVFEPYMDAVRADTAGGQKGIQAAIASLHGDLGRMHREIEELTRRVREIEGDARRSAQISRHVFDQEVDNRRRLHELRCSEKYELAFTEEDPLVSFIVPTYDSYETLRDVALPSILDQTHSNLEVVVVGDCSPPETEQAIAEIDDPRVSFHNRTIRGPYPEDPAKRWYVIGTPPYNEALARARGCWIAGLGDDDQVRPDHTERLLAAAREGRYEHCYGRQLVKFPNGETLELGEFPPELGEWGLQAAIFHGGLRFFELELSDTIYEEPNDWSFCRRMLRAGVRFGMLDEVVVDKHETRRASVAEWRDGSVPRVED